MNYREIDPETALEELRLHPQMQILDVREPWEFETFHIEGVTFIPLGELAERYTEVDASRPVLCVCAGGVRSARAAKFLGVQGYGDVINMAEGMNGWETRGLPTSLEGR